MNVSRITHHASRITLAAALALVLLSMATSTPAQIPFSLDTANWPDPKAISLVIPDNGLITIQFVRTNSAAQTNALEFKLLGFRDVTTGEPLPVTMYIPGQGSRSNSVEQFDLQLQPGQALLQIVLVITAPSSTNTYLGSLGLRENSGLWSLQKLALHRSAPQKQATLVVDQPTLNVPVTSPLFATRHVSTPDVSVTIHDETKTWPLEGISISPRVISSPAREALNFDKNVIVTLNGVLVSNLTQSPSDPSERAQRSIQAGGQAVLGLAFVGLNPGEYTIELKLLALNSKDDDKQQKLTINVKVSHSIWPAAGILVIALLLSFVTYKLLRVYQQSLGFQSRLAALNPPWLKELPPYYSVVWARIAVEETGHLVRRLLFINPASVNERIDRVPPVLEALNEARHARIAMRQLRQLVINRFDSVVSGHIRSMSDRDMNKDAAQKARDALSALNDSYWAEVQKEVTSFFSEFSDQDVDSFRTSLNNTGMTSGGKTDVDTILSTRKAPSKPTNLIDMMEYEKNYMKVKFLFERREWKEFPGLINVFEQDLEQTFDVVNKADWARIQEGKLRVHPPMSDGVSTHEQFEPLVFDLTTGIKWLDDTYLFHRGLVFRWHIELKYGRHEKKKKSYDLETLSPRLVHFAVKPGTISVSATALLDTPRGQDTKECLEAATLPIDNSSEFAIFQHLELAELLFLFLALLFALISGLFTLYYKNPTFGSFQDYLMLFLWGVGVDQTKNFLQVMQSQKSDSTT